LLSVPACLWFVDACAAPKCRPVGRFGGQRLVQGGHGKTGIATQRAMTAGFPAGGMQRVNDGIENAAAAVIAPPCGVKGQSELSIAVVVHISDAVNQLGHPRAAAHPVLGSVLDRGTNPPTAVTQQRHQQPTATLEVMVNTRVGHANTVGDGTHLDRTRTALDQQFLSGFEY